MNRIKHTNMIIFDLQPINNSRGLAASLQNFNTTAIKCAKVQYIKNGKKKELNECIRSNIKLMAMLKE